MYTHYRCKEAFGVCRDCSGKKVAPQQSPVHHVLPGGAASHTQRVSHVAHQPEEARLSLHLRGSRDRKDCLSLSHLKQLPRASKVGQRGHSELYEHEATSGYLYENSQ